MSQIFLDLLCLGDKRLLSEFLRKWGSFQGHNECFPKYLGYKLKFQKTETWFCRWKSTDKENNIFLSLESPCSFLLPKEKTWKGILTLIVIKNGKEKLIMPFKTVNWLFMMSFIHACFDWKIVVFQQIIVRVYYILKGSIIWNYRAKINTWLGSIYDDMFSKVNWFCREDCLLETIIVLVFFILTPSSHFWQDDCSLFSQFCKPNFPISKSDHQQKIVQLEVEETWWLAEYLAKNSVNITYKKVENNCA